MVDESFLIEVKSKVKKTGFELEEVVLSLLEISGSDAIDFELMNHAEIEKAKAIWTKDRQPLSLNEIAAHEKDIQGLWRNGYIGRMLKESGAVTVTGMRFAYNAYGFCLAMERAVVTNRDSDFCIVACKAVKLFESMGGAASAILAEISLMEKANRKRQGKKNMLETSSGNTNRDEKIKAAYAQLVVDSRQREAAGILASRFNLTPTRIRTIVKQTKAGLPTFV